MFFKITITSLLVSIYIFYFTLFNFISFEVFSFFFFCIEKTFVSLFKRNFTSLFFSVPIEKDFSYHPFFFVSLIISDIFLYLVHVNSYIICILIVFFILYIMLGWFLFLLNFYINFFCCIN